MNQTLSKNLQQLLKRHGITEAELARQTLTPQPTLHKILSGGTIDPRISTLSALAKYFQIPLDDLLVMSMGEQPKPATNLQSIPVLSWKDCLLFKLHAEWHMNPHIEWITSDNAPANAFALRSKPSMEPRFTRQTLLIIDPNATPEDGDFVIVHFADSPDATLRQLSADGPIKLLLSPNPHIKPTLLEDNTTILGVLIRSIYNHK